MSMYSRFVPNKIDLADAQSDLPVIKVVSYYGAHVSRPDDVYCSTWFEVALEKGAIGYCAHGGTANWCSRPTYCPPEYVRQLLIEHGWYGPTAKGIPVEEFRRKAYRPATKSVRTYQGRVEWNLWNGFVEEPVA